VHGSPSVRREDHRAVPSSHASWFCLLVQLVSMSWESKVLCPALKGKWPEMVCNHSVLIRVRSVFLFLNILG
jgi:hypothetical protein